MCEYCQTVPMATLARGEVPSIRLSCAEAVVGYSGAGLAQRRTEGRATVAEGMGMADLGDRSAFGEIVDRYADDLFRLAFSLLGNAADAEDVLQETFLAAFRRRRTFEGRSSVRTWLVGILVRQTARHHRYWRLRRALSLEGLPEAVLAAFGRQKDAGAMSGHETGMDVESMLGALSPEHREALVLREVEGLSYKEISEVLDVPIGTVESRLFRARRDLKARFKDYFS